MHEHYYLMLSTLRAHNARITCRPAGPGFSARGTSDENPGPRKSKDEYAENGGFGRGLHASDHAHPCLVRNGVAGCPPVPFVRWQTNGGCGESAGQSVGIEASHRLDGSRE